MPEVQIPTTGPLPGLTLVTEVNAALAAEATLNETAGWPTAASLGLASLAGVVAHNTTTGQIGVRDQADTTWVVIGGVDEVNKVFDPAGIACVGGTARNLVVTNSGHTATITADEIILENATGQYMVSKAVNQAINYSASGANGLDTGTVAASTWYYHWLIYNPTTAALAALGSLGSTAPTLPSGYTFKARVGAEQTNAGANLCPSIQVGRTLQRQDPLIYVMASGPATWPTAVAIRPAWVPPTATKLIVAVWMNNNGLYISPNSSYEMMALQGIANQSAFPLTLILESGSIYWGVNSSGGVLYLIGWEDSI